MKCFISCCFVFVLSLSLLQARIWKDAKGRSMVADLVSASDSEVTVLKAGKQFTVPLSSLCEDDQKYVKDWLEETSGAGADANKDFGGGSGNGSGAGTRPAAAGKATFDGQPLIPGGKVNKYGYDYDPERLAKVKKWKSDDTGYRIAIAIPHDFDPSKRQKVFIPNTAVNNPKQGLSGNFGVVGFYAKKCVKNGWVCLAFDTNLGRKNHNADLDATFEKLNEVWPDIKNWEFAVGGFSGGSKACWWPAAYLIKNEYKVIGAMLSGCNYDTSGEARDDFKAPKAAYKDIKVLLSNGKWDEVAQVAKQESVEKSLNKNGMRNIRKTMHDGKHNLEYGQIDIALEWFNEK